jgi:hypothetical protein
MTDLDDQPLARTPSSLTDPEPPPPSRPPAALIVGGVLLLAAIGFGVSWWWSGRSARAPAETPAAGPVSSAVEVPPGTEPDAAAELPPLDQMDPFIRGLLGALSARPELARYLATDDLIRHLAVTIDRVSRGASPASELGMIAPAQPFAVSRRQGRFFVDPAGYRRYDGIVATIDSMDMAAVAKAYRTIRPRLDEAHRTVARGGGDIDRAVRNALTILRATPVPPESPELRIGDGPNYVYADPALERLQPAQKHLVRLGPDHVRTITRKLEELDAALQ